MTGVLHPWHESWGVRHCEAIRAHGGVPPVATWSASVDVAPDVIAAASLCGKCAAALPDTILRRVMA